MVDEKPDSTSSPGKRLGGCLLAAAAVLAVDYLTGKHIAFPIMYVIPVAMAAWLACGRTAYSLAVLLPIARVGFHFLWEDNSGIAKELINAVISIAALVFYVYLVGRTAWQTKALKKEVMTLEGILRVCASCKKIRTESGEYQQIERYISEHSEARFSHGICPECAKKLYPEYYDKIMSGRGTEDSS